MNSFFSQLIKKIHPAPSVRQRELYTPARDWFLVLSIGFLCFVAGVGYAGYLFWKGSHMAAVILATPVSVQTIYDSEKVQSVLGVYTLRNTQQKELLAESVELPIATTTIPVATGTSVTPKEVINSPKPTEVPVAEQAPLQVE